MKNRETLQQLVLTTVQVHPEGVSHVELVQFILKSGYRHPGNLSSDLMQVVRFLQRQGAIQKNSETRKIRVNQRSVV